MLADVAVDSSHITLLLLEKPGTSVLHIHHPNNTFCGGGGWLHVESENKNGARDPGAYGKESARLGVQVG